VSLYEKSVGLERQNFRTQLSEFANFSRKLQLTPSQGGLGEALYFTDGRPYTSVKSWCIPQNDGPALRAIAMIQFARLLMAEKDTAYVTSFFYDSKLPTNSLIKTDLEYVSQHWRDPNCDLWEETSGDHFYTRMVQRRALLDGAKLAETLNDPLAASWYREQARELGTQILKHWDNTRGVFVPTLNQAGENKKPSGLDSSVILAILHGDAGDNFLPYSDPKVVSTFEKLSSKFAEIYPVNQRPGIAGIAIGRYPEDIYAGADFSGGNPWVLLTAAFGRYSYRLAAELAKQGRTQEASVYIQKGDEYMERIRAHANADGSLSEQIQRTSGLMMSARDLTWSYVEFIQAAEAKVSTGTF
jgi:glucoamylase